MKSLGRNLAFTNNSIWIKALGTNSYFMNMLVRTMVLAVIMFLPDTLVESCTQRYLDQGTVKSRCDS